MVTISHEDMEDLRFFAKLTKKKKLPATSAFLRNLADKFESQLKESRSLRERGLKLCHPDQAAA